MRGEGYVFIQPKTASHPRSKREKRFPIHKLNDLLARRGFDDFAEGLCAKFYHDSLGRPGIPPGGSSACC
jgi:hypothetical protein